MGRQAAQLQAIKGQIYHPVTGRSESVSNGDLSSGLSASAGARIREGNLTRLETRTAPRKAVNSLWCKRLSQCEWAFELMLDEGVDACVDIST